MELSYAQLNLVEEALRQYFGNKASDWVCSTNEQVALSRDEVASFVEEIIDRRAAASWSDWSVKAGDQVQTLVQLLPPAEIGTAHMEFFCGRT